MALMKLSGNSKSILMQLLDKVLPKRTFPDVVWEQAVKEKAPENPKLSYFNENLKKGLVKRN